MRQKPLGPSMQEICLPDAELSRLNTPKQACRAINAAALSRIGMVRLRVVGLGQCSEQASISGAIVVLEDPQTQERQARSMSSGQRQSEIRSFVR